MQKRIKEKLLSGIYNATEFIVQGNKNAKRTALSFFNDLRFVPIPDNIYSTTMTALADWFVEDLSSEKNAPQ